MSGELTKAASNGVASMLLDVQRECVEQRRRANALAEALRTALSEMLEARDRLLCSSARTSGLDHGIAEAHAALLAEPSGCEPKSPLSNEAEGR